MQAQHFIG